MQAYFQHRRIKLAVEQQYQLSNHLKSVHSDSTIAIDPEPTLDATEEPSHNPLQRLQAVSIPEVSIHVNASTVLKEAAQFPGVSIQQHGTTPSGDPEYVFLVEWANEDGKLNPRNFTTGKRVGVTLVVSALSFVVGIASSIDTAVLPQASQDLHVSEVVESIATGIYLLGFSFGSLFSGPLSEVFGRNVVYIGSLGLFSIFIMASALAPNIGAQLAFRCLAGIFGCPPLTCCGGTIADVWNPLEKTFSFPLYSLGAFGGPILGPIIASYIGQSSLSWRWAEWLTLIMAGLVMMTVLSWMPETYSPLLLTWKARHMREITSDPRYRSILEVEDTSLFTRMFISFRRQRQLITKEPVVLLIALYLSIVWIVLFTFFDGYTYIFTDIYHISQGLTNIIWIAMYIGIILGEFLVPFLYRSLQKSLLATQDTEKGTSMKIHPEVRLWYAMLCAPAIPVSLFWMGWTNYASISIWSPIIATTLFGYGILGIFISSCMYVIDSYDILSASALGFMTFSRYFTAGVMTIVGLPFYENMGTHWTLTILACISLLVTPLPYVLYHFGPAIRRRSHYALKD
ncbi:major facilitator superfamily domain-containing protein [Penicillium odoratum]|uniref:major facilitator superfamily domain-containing protein n=1 Tax=Penicillium odoratum TaxID=1167516 RepID=UPI0025496C26|nr:major facilitator superfamily domain-containing protein [Penicillium odoratum]KAJ5752644.1 major facilitator superfamily domain-containing protein [Penicillium odoratum]